MERRQRRLRRDLPSKPDGARGDAAIPVGREVFRRDDRRLSGVRLLTGYVWYAAISALGLLANVAIATLAFDELNGMTALSALAGIAIDAVWKFVVSSRVVWTPR